MSTTNLGIPLNVRQLLQSFALLAGCDDFRAKFCDDPIKTLRDFGVLDSSVALDDDRVRDVCDDCPLPSKQDFVGAMDDLLLDQFQVAGGGSDTQAALIGGCDWFRCEDD